MDVDAIDIGKEAYEQTGYQITKIQVTAYGLCPKCQEDVKQSGRSPLDLNEERGTIKKPNNHYWLKGFY